jgi:hypothetical protein
MATTTTASFMRRRASAPAIPYGAASATSPLPSAEAAFTAFFLPEATTATLALADAVGADMGESLLMFDVEDERLEEEEYLKRDLPESILPMEPEPTTRGRSASALSTVAIETAAAALTSWFTYEDFVADEDATEDEAVDEMDEDFLRDDYMQSSPVQEPVREMMPTPEKLSLIAEEDFAQTVASVQPYASKAFAWPWVRAN